jgi:hypothetical protein
MTQSKELALKDIEKNDQILRSGFKYESWTKDIEVNCLLFW